MQKIITFSILLTLTVIGRIEGAIQMGIFTDESHPGKCVIDSLVLSPGQTTRHPESCLEVHCYNATGFGHIYSCGALLAGPGCKLGPFRDPKADYPKCCERDLICN